MAMAGKNWYDPAPLNILYPWSDLNIPWTASPKEATVLADIIKQEGNESFKRGDFYDSLWKYEHSLTLLSFYPTLSANMPVILCNIAASCLKLGDEGRGDLIKEMHLKLLMNEGTWYLYCSQYATQALVLDPGAKIAYKAHWRRGESAKKIFTFPGMLQAIESVLHFMPGGMDPIEVMVSDYVSCFELQEQPDPKVLRDAIVLAIEYEQTLLLPVLTKRHVESGIVTSVLKEIMSAPNMTPDHLECFLLQMSIESSTVPHFDASWLSPTMLFKKKVFNVEVYRKLISGGMTVSSSSVESAVKSLTNGKLKLFKFLVSECTERDSLLKASELATSQRRKNFIDVLADSFEESFDKLRKSGDSLFSRGEYTEALNKYCQAISFCKKRNMRDEIALIRANCAQTSLKLGNFQDAHVHSCECIRMDPQNHKGYFRRAEALQLMLVSSSSVLGTHMDVVKDYLKCHGLQANVDAFSKAVIMAVKHRCTRVIPKLRGTDVKSGFSTRVLQCIMEKATLTENLIEFVILKLPDSQVNIPYDTTFISLKTIISVTTMPLVITRLVYWGVSIEEDDILAAVILISDSKAFLLDLILSHNDIHRDDAYQACINNACNVALAAKKDSCVLALMKHGSMPSLELLCQIPNLGDEHVVKKYCEDLYSMHHSPQMAIDGDLTCEDSEKIKELAGELSKNARVCFKSNNLDGAKTHYKEALKLCEFNKFMEDSASLHNNLAHLCIKMKQYPEAYYHSNACIEIVPDNSKAYFRRAEALKSALKCKEDNIRVPKSLSICDAIIDYLESYRLKQSLKTLVEAIPLAIEYDQLPLIYRECSALPEDSCLAVLQDLMKRKDGTSSVLMFLMMKAWKSKKIDCSSISLLSLIVDKGITNQKLLSVFLDSGVLVSAGDVHAAICHFPDANLGSFKLLLCKCEKVDKTDLCQDALKEKRLSFVLYLIENGAHLPKDHEMMIRCLLKLKRFDGVKMILKLLSKEAIKRIDLAKLLETNLVSDHSLIEELISAGVNPNWKKTAITAVMGLQDLKLGSRIKLVCLLINCGADFNQLTHARGNTTTPLHVATELSLKLDGHTDLIEIVASSLSTSGCDMLSNEKGETPIHIAVKPHLKRDISSKVLTALLNTGLINSSLKDKSNKKAADYLQPTDPRAKMLQEYSLGRDLKPKKKHKKKRKSKVSENQSKPEPVATIPLDAEIQNRTSIEFAKLEFEVLSPHENKTIPKWEFLYEEKPLPDKLAYHIERVNKKDDSYFQVQEEMEVCQEFSLSYVTSPSKGQIVPLDLKKKSSPISSTAIKLHSSQAAEPISKFSNGIMDGSPSVQWTEFGSNLGDLTNFDDLPWEVEITRNVVKFFKNTKKFSSVDRISAARVIYSLAEGRRSDHLSKRVSSNPKSCLYEARITRAGRILWEKAISYSSKLTGQSETAVYTQVIRVWEVLLDHDDLDRKISYFIEQIEQSYKRGYMASVCLALKPINHITPQKTVLVRGQEVLDLPYTYTVQSQNLLRSDYHFIPAASTKDTEYNVTTFYSFDSMTVKSMIAGTNERRDYPFKEWQKEHEIIKIQSNEAILLLGRSGTGKTTCCLYRLWNEFKNYWDPTSKTFGWKIPRKDLISSSSHGGESEDILVGSNSELQTCYSDAVESPEYKSIEFKKNGIEPEEVDSPFLSSIDDDDSLREVIEENLHQIFVSKNYVLCDQMKRRFYSMAAACDFLENHVPYEHVEIPNSFSKFSDLLFPAFLTARQFYILLDNSLEDGKNFFVRDEHGNLQVKIASLDYDHEDPDLLWDFEESDSEGDDDLEVLNFTSEQPTQRQRSKKWTEVTALYFKEMIWPKIAHQCKLTNRVDPMLVWLEIQSFIKGSEVSITKGFPLNLTEYMAIGNKIAPNFSSHREVIFKLYKCYEQYKQNLRHSCYLFDECDLIIDLHQRLKKTRDVPWSIHSVYIDEVQDFTQAELAVFIHCSRDPNSMFFTGDTAQSIMRGIAFRFQDLRTCFYKLNCNTPSVSIPQKPLNLTINYRSHSGILKLAGSIIDLIKEFFRDSIDHLPDDQGMFPGPEPVFLDSCKVDDLSLLMSTNKRECSAIEFGAHQVILVQSKEAKDKIPQILKGAIILTIFESKGLEFDDVLLYNFFTDSMVDEKEWRVVASYLEMQHNAEKIKNLDKLPGAISEARSKPFDPLQHKSLNAELKYLYTAVTRAKCNLWIYDSNLKARLPMLDYWHKRNALRIVTAETGFDQKYSLVFASNSTPDQWKAQGDNFRKKHLWEQALLCYKRAGPDFIHLVKEAQAYNFLQCARLQKAWLFQKAALNFLESDDNKHSVQCISGAALCLKNSKPPRYNQAAKLFERLGDLVKAAQSYLKARDYENFVRVQENRGEYDTVIRSLLGKPFMRKRDALAKLDEYEKKGYHLDPKYTTSELSFSCAKFYSERKDKHTLLEVLKYMPEQEKRLKFMKAAELYDEAYKDCVANKQFSGAYRLALAHGWYDRAIDLATQEGDEVKQTKFTLLRAKHSYLNLPKNFSEKDVVDSDLVSKLKKVTASKDDLVKAEAHLLLGIVKKNPGPCISAKGQFNLIKHKAGILEAFEQVGLLGKVSDQEILDCCHIAKRASKTLREALDMNIDVQQAVKFYGLQLVGKAYLTSHFYHVWINFETFQKYKYEDAEHDLDHMIRLKPEVREVLANRYELFMQSWLGRFKLKSRLYAKWQSFKLHSDIWEKRCLSRLYSFEEVSSLAMVEYVSDCVHVLEFRLIRDETVDAMLVHFSVMFSPSVSSCLPCLNDQHVTVVRRSVNSLSCFKRKIENDLKPLCEDRLEKVLIDSWLNIWRFSSLCFPYMKQFLSKLDTLENDQNSLCLKDAPLGFVFWKSEKRFLHIFHFWLNSCKEIRENSKVLWAAKLAINHFLGNVVEGKSISISIKNSVNVLTIHCMSLFAMITHSNALLNYPQKFMVPHTYKHVMQMFNHMNCRKGTSDESLPSACVKEVSLHRDLRKLFTECKILLNKAMSYLVGTFERAPRYSVLRFGLIKYTYTDDTLECLILTLTLLGNLSTIQRVQKYEAKIFNMFNEFGNRNKEVPEYVKKVIQVYQNPEQVCRQPRLVFDLVEDLLSISKKNCSLSMIVFKRKHNKQGHIEIIPIGKPLLVKPVKQGNILSSGGVESHQRVSMKQPFPSLTELGVTPHGPIDTAIFSGSPPINSSCPSSIPYALGLPHSVISKQPLLPSESSDPLSVSLAHNTEFYPPRLSDSAIIRAEPSLKSDMNVDPNPPSGYSDKAPAFANTPQNISSLSVSAEQFIPHNFPSNISAPLQGPTSVPVQQQCSDGISSPGAAISNSNDYGLGSFNEKRYSFQTNVPADFSLSELPDGNQYSFLSESPDGNQYPFQSEAPADDELVTFADDFEAGYMLTQQEKPAMSIDPNVITNGIIDEENNFCNACGTNYQLDDLVDLEEDVEGMPILESYYAHVTSSVHSETSKAFLIFMEADAECNETLNIAEVKLQQCISMKEQVETERLDHTIDNLKEEIDKYNLTAAEVRENRKWNESFRSVKSKEALHHLLMEANGKLAEISQYKEQLTIKERMMELEEDRDDIEKLSEAYVNDVDDKLVQGHKREIRTEEQKVMARKKKRDKRMKINS